MRETRRAGFTLVELLTVIAIIAILAALILGLASNAQKKAARSKAESEVERLSNFVTSYQMKYGQVPAKQEDLVAELKKEKFTLTNATDALKMPLDPWGDAYEYERSSRTTFYLWSYGGDSNNAAVWLGNPNPEKR